MKAIIRSMRSPDAELLETYTPEDPDKFGLLIEIDVGSVGEPGADTFEIVVCSPAWMSERVTQQGPLVARHHIVFNEYNYPQLVNFISRLVENQIAPTWEELAERIGRIGKWEFEDYQE